MTGRGVTGVLASEVSSVSLPVSGPEPAHASPDATPSVVWQAVGPVIDGVATHYGVAYAGSTLACGGVYDPADPAIIAVGPPHNSDWPCGANLGICGDSGCIVGARADSCPGCGQDEVDLSEAGIALACGPDASVCDVKIESVVAIPIDVADPAAAQPVGGEPPQ